MVKFYYHPSPNPVKVALMLEETGLPYEVVSIDTRKGEQHDPAFVAINPNAKTPAIVDGDTTVFESSAIMLYLAEKSGQFMPMSTHSGRDALLSWLMFVATGIGTYHALASVGRAECWESTGRQSAAGRSGSHARSARGLDGRAASVRLSVSGAAAIARAWC